jgi:hypothetical protein
MPQIKMSFVKDKSDEEIWSWLKSNFDRKIRGKIAIENIKLSSDIENGKLDFTGKTVSGSIEVNSGNIDVFVNIPLLYRPFVPRIKSAVSKVIEEI